MMKGRFKGFERFKLSAFHLRVSQSLYHPVVAENELLLLPVSQNSLTLQNSETSERNSSRLVKYLVLMLVLKTPFFSLRDEV